MTKIIINELPFDLPKRFDIKTHPVFKHSEGTFCLCGFGTLVTDKEECVMSIKYKDYCQIIIKDNGDFKIQIDDIIRTYRFDDVKHATLYLPYIQIKLLEAINKNLDINKYLMHDPINNFFDSEIPRILDIFDCILKMPCNEELNSE